MMRCRHRCMAFKVCSHCRSTGQISCQTSLYARMTCLSLTSSSLSRALWTWHRCIDARSTYCAYHADVPERGQRPGGREYEHRYDEVSCDMTICQLHVLPRYEGSAVAAAARASHREREPRSPCHGHRPAMRQATSRSDLPTRGARLLVCIRPMVWFLLSPEPTLRRILVRWQGPCTLRPVSRRGGQASGRGSRGCEAFQLWT